jgi:tetratricopeptide (TPR) repeat protein
VTIADSSAPSLRGRIPTGYGRLDEALKGGFLAGSAILLSAPASSEVPVLLRNFLKASDDISLLICRGQSSAEAVSQPTDNNLKCLICSEKAIPPSKNMLPGKGIDNLTELNFQITETIGSVQPKRIVLEILSDILLRHKALQTRKWLNEFLEKLRSKGITTLALLNPYMHVGEEAQAVVDLFDGNLEIVEKGVEGQLRKFLRIKWTHGLEVAENELPLLDLTSQMFEPSKQPAVAVTHFQEPRWLTRLIGRTAELSRLKTALNDALNHKSSIVAVQGEAGVGKTRLMQELVVPVHEKGVVVLAGRAKEERFPYGPWVELLREYIGETPGELLRRILGSNASELARLVPDIAAKIGTVPPSRPLAEEQDRIRLYEAITQFLISICSEKTLVLLLDDMHWTDQASLGLLEHFVMGSSNYPVLTLVGYRTEDVNPDSPLSKSLMKLNREHLLGTVSVKNLTMEETTELIKEIFGEEAVSPEFSGLMFHRTGGNPFFVEEVLRSLVEDGTVFRTEKGWDRKPIQEIVLPDSVKSVLKSRLTKLQPETLNVLNMASVVGSEFDFEVLRVVTQTQEDTLLERLEESIAAGLISEEPNRKDVFRFPDNRIRELLLGDLIQSRRIRYHIRIAEAMEKAYSKNLENQAETIATHFSNGGDTERTGKYSLMAGDRNRAIHAYDQAISDYKRAIDIIELEGNKEKDTEPLLEKLAECYLFAGQYNNAIHTYEQALAVLEKSSDSSLKSNDNMASRRDFLKIVLFGGGITATAGVTEGVNYLVSLSQKGSYASALSINQKASTAEVKWPGIYSPNLDFVNRLKNDSDATLTNLAVHQTGLNGISLSNAEINGKAAAISYVAGGVEVNCGDLPPNQSGQIVLHYGTGWDSQTSIVKVVGRGVARYSGGFLPSFVNPYANSSIDVSADAPAVNVTIIPDPTSLRYLHDKGNEVRLNQIRDKKLLLQYPMKDEAVRDAYWINPTSENGREVVQSLFSELSDAGEPDTDMARELSKLPDLQGLYDDVLVKAGENIICDSLLSGQKEKAQTMISAMLNEGIKEKRKYCSPAQAWLWDAKDEIFDPTNNPLLTFSTVSDFVLDSWRNSSTSRNYTSERWTSYEEARDRVNSPALVNGFIFDYLTFDIGRDTIHPQGPRLTYKVRKGDCRHACYISTDFLTSNGYDSKNITVLWALNQGHSVSTVMLNDGIWLVVDFRGRYLPMKGPFKTYDDIIDYVAASYGWTIYKSYIEDNSQLEQRNNDSE